jgi:hypothetical protein
MMALRFKKTQDKIFSNITGKKVDVYVAASGTKLFRIYQPVLGNPDKKWKLEVMPISGVGNPFNSGSISGLGSLDAAKKKARSMAK